MRELFGGFARSWSLTFTAELGIEDMVSCDTSCTCLSTWQVCLLSRSSTGWVSMLGSGEATVISTGAGLFSPVSDTNVRPRFAGRCTCCCWSPSFQSWLMSIRNKFLWVCSMANSLFKVLLHKVPWSVSITALIPLRNELDKKWCLSRYDSNPKLDWTQRQQNRMSTLKCLLVPKTERQATTRAGDLITDLGRQAG